MTDHVKITLQQAIKEWAQGQVKYEDPEAPYDRDSFAETFVEASVSNALIMYALGELMCDAYERELACSEPKE